MQSIHDKLLDSQQSSIFDKYGYPAGFRNAYMGCSAILLAGGPSAREHVGLLQKTKPLTISVNNMWTVFEPDIWVSIDTPSRFAYEGWANPKILKFSSITGANTRLASVNESGEKVKMQLTPSRAPNSFLYAPTTGFSPNVFFQQSKVCVGNSDDQRGSDGIQGGRNVILAAIKIAHHLGISNLTIVGMDLKMTKNDPYAFTAFSSEPSDKYVKHFNENSNKLSRRLALLGPVAKRDGLNLRMVGNGPLASESIQEAIDRCVYQSPVGVCVKKSYEEAK